MAFSYSGIVNYGKNPLPSVEGWGTNMNILRDPPKAIITRRKDKVGDTSSITNMIGENGTRFNEAIQVFARGINPSVSVSYSNHGTGNGNMAGMTTPIANGSRNASLPYKVIRDGAFYPPINRLANLQALSRTNRLVTCASTQPGFVDYSKKARVCGTAKQTREVKTTTLKACVRPTAKYIIHAPIKAPNDIKKYVNNKINVSANSGTGTNNIIHQTNLLHSAETRGGTTTQNTAFRTNPNDKHRQVNNSKLPSTDKFVHNKIIKPEAYTNPTSKVHNTTSIDELFDLSAVPVQNIRTSSCSAPISGSDYTKHMNEKDMSFNRNVPEYSATTNTSNPTVKVQASYDNKHVLTPNKPRASFSASKVRRNSQPVYREAKLGPTLKLGGFTNVGVKPRHETIRNVQATGETQKSRTSRFVNREMQERYSKPSPWQQ